MFGKRKPTTVELSALILQGVDPEVFGPQLYAATMGKYYIKADEPECDIARKYGATLKSVDDLMTFYKSVTPTGEGNINLSRWLELHAEVACGFLEAGRVKTAADAIALPRHFCGASFNPRTEHLEAELVKRALPLLTERRDILDFACALRTYKGMMLFSIALGYAPLNTFDEAVKAHREELARYAEEEASRQRNVM